MVIDMKNTVIIKSFQNGISLYLDETLPFDELLEEVAVKFREADHFFKDAKMALSVEGRQLTAPEEKQLVGTICGNSHLHIVCLVGKDGKTNQTYLKAVQQVNKKEDTAAGQICKGTLHKGQVLETENSIILIGDVETGAAVVSQKDIIIIGSLHGKAYAGGGGSPSRFVAALDMSPEKLRIGDFTYNPSPKSKMNELIQWKRTKAQPMLAYIKEGMVVTEPITKELLNNLPV